MDASPYFDEHGNLVSSTQQVLDEVMRVASEGNAFWESLDEPDRSDRGR